MSAVLILDDDAELGDALRLTLHDHQIEADWVGDAKQAIERLKDNTYDLVLLDYALPQYDGIWFMRNAKMPRKTKVLLMTGYLSRDVINDMFALGAAGYMIKPFDNDTLMHNIRYYLEDALSA